MVYFHIFQLVFPPQKTSFLHAVAKLLSTAEPATNLGFAMFFKMHDLLVVRTSDRVVWFFVLSIMHDLFFSTIKRIQRSWGTSATVCCRFTFRRVQAGWAHNLWFSLGLDSSICMTCLCRRGVSASSSVRMGPQHEVARVLVGAHQNALRVCGEGMSVQ